MICFLNERWWYHVTDALIALLFRSQRHRRPPPGPPLRPPPPQQQHRRIQRGHHGRQRPSPKDRATNVPDREWSEGASSPPASSPADGASSPHQSAASCAGRRIGCNEVSLKIQILGFNTERGNAEYLNKIFLCWPYQIINWWAFLMYHATKSMKDFEFWLGKEAFPFRHSRPIHHHALTRRNLPLRSHSLSQADAARYTAWFQINLLFLLPKMMPFSRFHFMPHHPPHQQHHPPHHLLPPGHQQELLNNNYTSVGEERKYKTLDLREARNRRKKEQQVI